MSDEADYIEDPEALRRAEEAVAHDRAPLDHPMTRPIDERWVNVASQVGEALVGGLRDVADALDASGVPMGWDPYDPRESPAFTPPILSSRGRTFSIAVPASQVAAARDVLAGPAPEGVTYSWDAAMTEARDAMAEDAERAPRRAADAGAETPFAPSPRAQVGEPPVTLVTGTDPRTSDNARLAGMAGGGGPGVGALIAAGAVLLVLAAVVFMLLRG